MIGTCVEVRDLKRISQRFRHHIQNMVLVSDYDYHSFFVSISGEKNALSGYLNKWLNRQYSSFIQQAQKLKTERQILETWHALERNDIRALSGFFWAFLNSRHATQHAKESIYADIHMISHIAGRTEKSSTRKLIEDNQRLMSELGRKEQHISSKSKQLQDQYLTIEKLYSQNRALNRQLQEFQIHKDSDKPRREKYESQIVRQQRHIERLQARLERMQLKLELNTQTPQAPIRVHKQTDNHCDGDCKNCRETDLCGKTILYVGGFSRHRKKFEQVTESINGNFYYHDGGLQQSEHQLDDLIRKADCVFCPVDCVSHNAIGRIKNLVKQQCKDCVFLKSASLSSFRNEVIRYAS